jgi:hypothetical protein
MIRGGNAICGDNTKSVWIRKTEAELEHKNMATASLTNRDKGSGWRTFRFKNWLASEIESLHYPVRISQTIKYLPTSSIYDGNDGFGYTIFANCARVRSCVRCTVNSA